MALVEMNFFSYVLGMDSSVIVLLPEKRQQPHVPDPGIKYPVLYLLHGHSDDHTSFIRKSNIERLVREHGIIAVMPNGHRSFYTNAKFGHNYYDFFSKELPVVINNYFPASTKREDNFIAGISMGGYGALKIALNNPDKFKAVGCLSGVISPLEAIGEGNFTVSDFSKNLFNIFGSKEEFNGSINDIYFATQQLDSKDILKPSIYHTCGKEDPLYKSSLGYRDFMKNMIQSIDYTFEEREGGHNWEFWNEQIPSMLRRFGLI